MYYLLNFYDHTFKTCNTEKEVAQALTDALDRKLELDYFEVVDCFDESIRKDGATFLRNTRDGDSKIWITVYCDDTGLFTEEECELENLCEAPFPEDIVREWYMENKMFFDEDTAEWTGIPISQCDYKLWLNNAYTAESVIGLCAFAAERGYTLTRDDLN